MTLDDLARLAMQPAAEFHAAVCEHWGLDPAAFLHDSYLAYQFRVALFVTTRPEPANDPDDQEREVMGQMKRLMR